MGDIQFNGTPEEWDTLVKKNKKKETLEEAAERYAKGKSSAAVFQKAHTEDFIEGAKSDAAIAYLNSLQAERMYSEEEVVELLEYIRKNFYDTGSRWHSEPDTNYTSKELIKQFKKK